MSTVASLTVQTYILLIKLFVLLLLTSEMKAGFIFFSGKRSSLFSQIASFSRNNAANAESAHAQTTVVTVLERCVLLPVQNKIFQ